MCSLRENKLTKQQREIIITVGLVFILVIALSASFGRMKKRSPKRKEAKKELSVTETKETEPVKVQERKSLSEAIQKMQLGRWRQNWKRDPFLLSLPREEKKKSLLRKFSFSHSGIVWKEGKPLALIDDYIVKEGDTIENYTVIKIDRERVILEEAGKKYELLLKRQ